MERTKSNNHTTSEDSYMEALALEAFSSDGYLVINKTLIKALGLVPAALLSIYIDQYKYVRKKNPENNGWFYVTHESIIDQLLIPESVIRKTKSLLRDELHIIQTKFMGVPAKEFIKIDFLLLIGSMGICISKNNSLGVSTTRPLGVSTSEGLRVSTSRPLIYNENRYITNEKNFIEIFPNKFKNDPNFVDILQEFYNDRKEKKNPLTSRAQLLIKNKLVKYPVEIGIQAITKSIESGWASVFPESIKESKSSSNYKPTQFRPEYKENAGVRYYLNVEDGEYYHRTSGEKYIE